jgi:imidazolonepropionase-like amidohydrolase
MNLRSITAPLLFGALACLPTMASSAQNAAASAPQETKRSWTIRAERIHTVSGQVIEGGLVRIENGRIAAIVPGGKGGDFSVYAITPGLIDLSPEITLGIQAVEEDREVTPEMRLVDALNLFSTRFGRELNSGVTTVLLSQPDRNVIGGLAAVVKTGGPETLEARLVKADALMAGVFGSSPSSGNSPAFFRPAGLFNRRPTTRMGVEWEARKALYDALYALEDGVELPGSVQLQAVLKGEMSLLLQASATQDIRTALYLKEEFGIPKLIVSAAAEAWKEPEILQRSGAAVVLPPFTWNGTTTVDRGFMAWNTAHQLEQLGITFALSGRGSADPDARLALQPAFAVRAGVNPDLALKAATLIPAQLLGIQDRVGSLEVGRDADLALWNGEPTRFTSTVVGVLLNGALVKDPR